MASSTEHDFDFLIGRWKVGHRRLRTRLAGSDEWQSFDGTCAMQTLLGGRGNVDDNVIDAPAGRYCAASVRAFDIGARQWSIWWLDERHPHRLDPPVVGGFDDGDGVFFADDEHDGRPIRVRFRWLGTRSATPSWEQAFSADGGSTWEVNWTMRFERAGD